MRKHWYIAFLLGLVTLLYAFPILRNPARNIADGYDGVFSTWGMNWSAWSILFHLQGFYDAPIFYPYTSATTFSDPMFSSGLLAAPLLLTIKEPLIANAVSVVLGFFLLALGTYAFIEKVTRQRAIAFATALLVSFGSVHIRYLGHLHTFFIPAIPWGLFVWFRYIETKDVRFLVTWTLLFLFQVFNSPLSGVFYLFSCMLFIFHKQSVRAFKKHIRLIGIILGFTLVVSLLFYLPYVLTATQYHSARTIRDAAHFALSVDELIGSSRGLSFAGWGLFLFTAYTLYQSVAHKRKTHPLAVGSFVIACATLVMTLGPALKWAGNTVKIPFPIPLPYVAAYALIPGFQAFRDPSRWMLLSFFMLCITAAFVIPKKRGVLFLLVSTIMLMAEWGWSYPTVTLPSWKERPAVYRWIQTQKATTVLFLPPHLYAFPETAVEETRRMLWTLPWDRNQVLRLYNGYSGFAPQERVDEIVRFAMTFPSQDTVEALRQLSPDIVIINHEFQRVDRETAIQLLGYQKTYQDDAFAGYTKTSLSDR